MSLRKTLRVARNALNAYDPGTVHGREALLHLDASGLAQLRMLNELSPGAELLLFGTLPVMTLLSFLVGLAGVFYGLPADNLPVALGAVACFVLATVCRRMAETWEPSVTTLGTRFKSLAGNPVACQTVRDLALTHPGAQAYRNAVVARRELVAQDVLAMQALERATRHEAWLAACQAEEAARKEALKRLERQAHGEAVLD